MVRPPPTGPSAATICRACWPAPDSAIVRLLPRSTSGRARICSPSCCVSTATEPRPRTSCRRCTSTSGGRRAASTRRRASPSRGSRALRATAPSTACAGCRPSPRCAPASFERKPRQRGRRRVRHRGRRIARPARPAEPGRRSAIARRLHGTALGDAAAKRRARVLPRPQPRRGRGADAPAPRHRQVVGADPRWRH